MNNKSLKSIEFAKQYAELNHRNQLYGEHPYMFHLEEVRNNCISSGNDDDNCIIISYLHDIIEDTLINENDIELLFGSYIAICVYIITDPPYFPRPIRKQIVNYRLTIVGDQYPEALIVKVADRLANVRRSVIENNDKMFNMYKNEFDDFYKVIKRPYTQDNLDKIAILLNK